MARYHINGEGEPGVCKAQQACPFGTSDEHYDSAAAARTAYEEVRSAAIVAPPLRKKAGYSITSEDAETFTRGGCFQLAQELSQRTGWPLVGIAIRGESSSNGYQHYLVRRPDGLLLDVNGPETEETITEEWALTLEEDRGEYGYECVARELTPAEAAEAARFDEIVDATYPTLPLVADSLLENNPLSA